VKSYVTKSFRKLFEALPEDIQARARTNYKLWREDNFHSSLQFKKVSRNQEIYSVRIGLGYRALGLVEAAEIYWFWIGPHGEYDKLLKRL